MTQKIQKKNTENKESMENMENIRKHWEVLIRIFFFLIKPPERTRGYGKCRKHGAKRKIGRIHTHTHRKRKEKLTKIAWINALQTIYFLLLCIPPQA